MLFSALPGAQGLYDPANEADSCGVAMITDIRGRRSHGIVTDGLTALEHLEHRGAAGAEPNSGDGAGILLQLPVELLREMVDFALPETAVDGSNTFAAGTCFLPQDEDARSAARARIAALAAEEGLEVLGWRAVPVDPDGAGIGTTARSCMPHMAQLFVAAPEVGGVRAGGIELDRKVYPLRKRAEQTVGADAVYFASLSSRTIVYKGMLTTMQLPQYFPDLRDERCVSAIAIVHSRFSTNTFPSWPLAHPFRFVAHNGEINTVRGNRNRMHAREALLASARIPGDLSRLSPICTADASDSASFDEVLELLHLGGRSLPHAALMMIPEAWENATTMDSAERAFWKFHASLMEPWDGPACVTFTDGTVVGAVLDRNGLRPGRWWRTVDDRIILASESGVLDVPSGEIVAKGRLQPGKMFLVDTAAGRIVTDDEVKEQLAAAEPYSEWLHAGLLDLSTLPERSRIQPNHESVVRRQIAFGYTEEELRILLTPMAASGGEPLGSMGTDTPVAVLSKRSRLLYDYFIELFAQVTNPPLDSIREEVVTSMARVMGPEENLLEPTAASCRQIVLRRPVLDNDDLGKIVHINDDGEHPGLRTNVLRALYDVERGGEGLAEALDDLQMRATEAIAKGARTLVISDRDSDHTRAPVPSLLAVSAVHHHLVRTKERTKVALVVESGDAREVHHIAMLIGFGAAAVNPYLAFESIEDLIREGELTGIETAAAVRNYVTALGKGVVKVMSKMGISTVASYTAAQVFEAIGLSPDVVDEYFTGTTSQLGGVGLDVLAEEVKLRHRRAYPENPTERVHRRLEVGGEYAFRREGELHLFTPEVVFLLQHSTRTGRRDIFAKYSEEVDRLSREGGTLRGLFEFKQGLRPPVPLDEVEPVEAIVKRFNTGAMSYGSISAEAHETMAIAMNNLGGRSNSGEGGEDVDRLYDPRRRSAVKQVASGRFGVTSDYLVNATDIQIKMAQGAKPGEGGQLPGYKVYPNIAKTRHSTPGVGLISPPPHHDIYSIEDLAQLIHDLKNANADARIHVKLVSSVGVGTVAAGVSKAHADVVLISGYDGGTGAAPLTSLKHAGAPWEIGLADTQQTLVLNGLRDRITVQCDGGMRNARDVIVAALLGAEEFGFATAPLVVSGCIMMRVCHLDTCPVGVATQNPELRARFNGKPEFVENFFTFIAEDIRRYLAELGFRSLDEAVGHAEVLDTDPGVAHWKSRGLDLSPIFAVPNDAHGSTVTQRRRVRDQHHGLEQALDRTLIQLAEGALEDAHPVRLELPVRNVNRTVGTLLGSEVTRRYGAAGLPDNTIHVTLTGAAGQSIGAFLPPGVTLELIGDANDYVGKGLSGGRVIVRPPDDVLFLPEDNVIAGNTLLYGATSGEVFLRGRVGERFCARNSGALAVVEGVGDHACEYMTGGRVVILGKTGRNLAAGMSGGIAYVLGLDPARVNTEMVELQRLEAEDLAWLHDVVSRHVRYTESTLAASILADWPRRSAQFTKVMPTDYQRVMQATRMAKAEGRDVDSAIMEASRG
ncbi:MULTISPECIES: glutamate synthase large subunit [unclassified Mycolicibacterium]|uniref:glutamate synthase large subunit n=1 Tax=unclassified Mycolicibacterium TaxID=2636767 RepID=UPI00130A204F|nr:MULTISPECIES: glutamate synthase large subunit [unclassified Mycolicibacterium]MUL84628.1 glutamate synthase large subunit [Mycolicibacterium sp. CBMA 329]MUL88403.1 glutamate synthase large subunit [Mycolicibacterium sp. CBMA 331]MUM25090.1 glutamate synthase large subunit [Mycolicibacterium sp. CBMA 295]MUM40050.1 glutamate synthase large subunit [Mycolicibacterium sp. CBMA 247]MUM44468.1 glutamate synthase large subunit [Mycolicibacterium sp. CBMA 294]